jgi:hypothetical protein
MGIVRSPRVLLKRSKEPCKRFPLVLSRFTIFPSDFRPHMIT